MHKLARALGRCHFFPRAALAGFALLPQTTLQRLLGKKRGVYLTDSPGGSRKERFYVAHSPGGSRAWHLFGSFLQGPHGTADDSAATCVRPVVSP